MLRSFVAVLAGYLVFGISAALLFILSGQDPHQVPSLGFAIGSILYGMSFAFAGGWLAAFIAKQKEVGHAIAVALIIFALAVLSLVVQSGKGSMWSQLSTLFLMAPSAVIGGLIRRRTKKSLEPWHS